MNALLVSLLAVMLLSGPEETVDVEGAAAVSEDADRVELQRPVVPGQSGRKRIEIVSETSDFDRQSGVIRFEGSVQVVSSDEIELYSDEAFAFLSPSNELTRIVVIGNVAITNEAHSGTCAWATYRRKKREVEMFGDGESVKAELVDSGKSAGRLAGKRIRFWLDTEQVEVEDAGIRIKKNDDIRKAAASGREKGR